MVNFYHSCLIEKCAQIQKPLNRLASNSNRDINWQPAEQEGFEQLKNAIAQATTLSHPNPGAELTLTTDASNTGIGAVIHQIYDGQVTPLCFFSRGLNAAQVKFSTYDKELYTIYAAIKHFRYILEGRHFTIFTDHKPLTFAFNQNTEKASPRELRQLSFISEFSTDIKYVPRGKNVVADALSRLEISTISFPKNIDYAGIAANQMDDEFTNLCANPKLL